MSAIFINWRPICQHALVPFPAWGWFTHLLLLHKLRVGAVVDNILAKHGGGEDGVNLLGVDVADLAVQDKVVALGADIARGLLAEEDKGEAVAILGRRDC